MFRTAYQDPGKKTTVHPETRRFVSPAPTKRKTGACIITGGGTQQRVRREPKQVSFSKQNMRKGRCRTSRRGKDVGKEKQLPVHSTVRQANIHSEKNLERTGKESENRVKAPEKPDERREKPTVKPSDNGRLGDHKKSSTTAASQLLRKERLPGKEEHRTVWGIQKRGGQRRQTLGLKRSG